MVAIQAIQRKHFPIRPDAVLLRARDNTPAFLGLIENEIDVFLRVSQIRDEILDIAIKAHEVKPAIVVDSWRRGQTHRLLVKTFAVSRLIRHADKIPLVVESPGVIKALEKFGVALVDATDVGAPMGAAVIKYSHSRVAAAHPKERLAGHRPAPKVAGVGKLRFVTEIEPAALENVCLLQRSDLSRSKRRAVHSEHSSEPVLVN